MKIIILQNRFFIMNTTQLFSDRLVLLSKTDSKMTTEILKLFFRSE